MKNHQIAYALTALVAVIAIVFGVAPMIEATAQSFAKVDAAFHLANGKLTEQQQH